MKQKSKLKIPYYTLTMSFKCRTNKQAKELSEKLDQVFKEKIDEWCGGFAKKFENAKRTAKRGEK